MSGARVPPARRVARPLAFPGMRIGLLGGSFNPPHDGHIHASRQALRALGLERIWWLVSPQNPLKPTAGMAPLERRVAAAEALVRDPRLVVTALERDLGTRYTVDTLRALKRRYPRVHFVWIMGSDGFATLERWRQWRTILALVPILVIARPGFDRAARTGRAARHYAGARRPPREARRLVEAPLPAWTLLPGRLHGASSTALRHAGRWPPTA